MGLFNIISDMAQSRNNRIISEKLKFSEKIQEYDLPYICRYAVKELRYADAVKRSAIFAVVKERMEKVSSDNELYDAFRDMYEMSKRDGNMYAYGFSQRIGEFLHTVRGDYRISRNDEDTHYLPKFTY